MLDELASSTLEFCLTKPVSDTSDPVLIIPMLHTYTDFDGSGTRFDINQEHLSLFFAHSMLAVWDVQPS